MRECSCCREFEVKKKYSQIIYVAIMHKNCFPKSHSSPTYDFRVRVEDLRGIYWGRARFIV